MKETVVVIFGEESEWLQRFAEALRERTKARMKVLLFAEENAARIYLTEKPVDLAILPEKMAEDFSALTETLYFTEEERPEDDSALYRYRKMSQHLKAIEAHLGRDAEISGSMRAEVHAVYSPVRGAGQTAAALILAQLLGERGSSLLISTERYSALPALLSREKEGSLAELLYFAHVKVNVSEHLPEVEEREDGFSWICPAPEAEDLRSAAKEDWDYLIGSLRAGAAARYIVIDAGDGAADETWLLELADRIWMPLRSGGIGLHRERAFCERLEREGRIELLSRIRRFSFPATEELKNPLDCRQLLHTAWGRYLRGLLREEEM